MYLILWAIAGFWSDESVVKSDEIEPGYADVCREFCVSGIRSWPFAGLFVPPERQRLHGYAKATITGAYPYVSWIMRIAEAEPWKGKKEMPKVRRISPPYGRGHTALSLHWQGYCREMASSRSLIARSVLAGVVAGASARLQRRSKTLDFVWAREADCWATPLGSCWWLHLLVDQRTHSQRPHKMLTAKVRLYPSGLYRVFPVQSFFCASIWQRRRVGKFFA